MIGRDAGIAVDVLTIFRDTLVCFVIQCPSTVHVVCLRLGCHHFVHYFLHTCLLVRLIVLVHLKAVLSLSLGLKVHY